MDKEQKAALSMQGFDEDYHQWIDEDNEALGYFAKPITPEAIPVINIVVNEVSGTLSGFADKAGEYTVEELTDYTATGSGLKDVYDMGLSKFRVPFVRQDTGTKRYMVATISNDGTFELKLNFKTGGEWKVDSQLLNSELTDEEKSKFTFEVNTQVFKVI